MLGASVQLRVRYGLEGALVCDVQAAGIDRGYHAALNDEKEAQLGKLLDEGPSTLRAVK